MHAGENGALRCFCFGLTLSAGSDVPPVRNRGVDGRLVAGLGGQSECEQLPTVRAHLDQAQHREQHHRARPGA